ncbi:MAG TPA: glycosyltransferase, partial [Verrucomicrobiae bacterium]
IAGFRAHHRLEGRKVVLSVGRVTWLKDYESFIDAIGLARQTRPEVMGFIVGGVAPDKEAYFKELQARVRRLGLDDHLVFAGSQSRMPEIYALADVLVNASLKMGNVGRTVAEGLAMNTPVLATTEKGLNNLVRDGVNGFIIKTRDAADLAAKMVQALEIPSANIRATVPDEFTLETMVTKTLEVYAGLLRSRGEDQ